MISRNSSNFYTRKFVFQIQNYLLSRQLVPTGRRLTNFRLTLASIHCQSLFLLLLSNRMNLSVHLYNGQKARCTEPKYLKLLPLLCMLPYHNVFFHDNCIFCMCSRKESTPLRADAFKQKQAYRLPTAQNTFQKKDFCCQYLAPCPSPPGLSASGRAGSKDGEAPSPPPLRPQPHHSLRRGNFQNSLRRNSALLPPTPGKKQLLLYSSQHFHPNPRLQPVALIGNEHSRTLTNHPISPPPQAPPPFCEPRLSCSAQARLCAGPGRQHGGRAEAGAGHYRAAGNRALGRRLHQPGPELRDGQRAGVREEQRQAGGQKNV